MTGSLYEYWQRHQAGEFSAGVQLLIRYAPKAVTSKILLKLQTMAISGQVPDEYLLGKLRNALSDVYEPAPEPASERIIVVQDDHQDTDPDTTPEKLRVEAAIPWHKKHSHHHAMMLAAQTDTDRATHASIIMREILPRLDALYDEARRKQQGADEPEPTPAAEEETNPSDLRKLHSLRTRVSRLRNQLIPNAPSVVRKNQLEKELALKLSAIEQLENKINT